jgi:hypothetical protein
MRALTKIGEVAMVAAAFVPWWAFLDFFWWMR